MALDQDIVVVNEFTTRSHDGKGTRGGTPGQYVLRYMSRDTACDPLPAPTAYIEDYMARATATEPLPVSGTDGTDPLDGIGFGRDGRAHEPSISMRATALRHASQRIQRLFDQGKTVFKTVISFTRDYLARHHIIPPNFHPEHKGDYRGHVDQTRLRQAILDGVESMGRGAHGFDDLIWVATIQTDTMHVHVHLCMADAGTGRMRGDGQQKGTLSKRDRQRLRTGIDRSLQASQQIHDLHAQLDHERHRLRLLVREHAGDTMTDIIPLQQILAALPDDKRLWKAGSHSPRMRHANQLAHDHVHRILERYGQDTQIDQAIDNYARHMSRQHDHDETRSHAYQRHAMQARQRIDRALVNALYQALAQQNAVRILHTGMLDQLADPEDDNDDGQGLLWGKRVRHASILLQRHQEERERMRAMHAEYQAIARQGHAGTGSQAMDLYWQTETAWHDQACAKYQHMLAPLQPHPQARQAVDRLNQLERQREHLASLLDDPAILTIHDPDLLEQYGRNVHQVTGAGQLADIPAGYQRLTTRLTLLQQETERQYQAATRTARDNGLALTRTPTGQWDLTPHDPLPFETTYWTDLHQDTQASQAAGPREQAIFRQWAALRSQRLADGIDYMQASNTVSQFEPLLDIDGILAMQRHATLLDTNGQPIPKQPATPPHPAIPSHGAPTLDSLDNTPNQAILAIAAHPQACLEQDGNEEDREASME